MYRSFFVRTGFFWNNDQPCISGVLIMKINNHGCHVSNCQLDTNAPFSYDSSDQERKGNKMIIKKFYHSFHRFYRIALLIVFVLGLQYYLPGLLAGNSSQTGGVTTAYAASDAVIAAAGDIACDPANSAFNSGNGNSTSYRQKYTSNLLVNAGLAAVLDLG
jgi:hypothetical protein